MEVIKISASEASDIARKLNVIGSGIFGSFDGMIPHTKKEWLDESLKSQTVNSKTLGIKKINGIDIKSDIFDALVVFGSIKKVGKGRNTSYDIVQRRDGIVNLCGKDIQDALAKFYIHKRECWRKAQNKVRIKKSKPSSEVITVDSDKLYNLLPMLHIDSTIKSMTITTHGGTTKITFNV